MRTELLFITKYKYTQCQHVSILTLVKHTKCTSPSIITPVRISRHIQHLFMYECSHSSQFLCSCFPILEDKQKYQNLSPWLLLVFTIASPIPQCIVGVRTLRSPHPAKLPAIGWIYRRLNLTMNRRRKKVPLRGFTSATCRKSRNKALKMNTLCSFKLYCSTIYNKALFLMQYSSLIKF